MIRKKRKIMKRNVLIVILYILNLWILMKKMNMLMLVLMGMEKEILIIQKN
jgi:hypothetical protein